MRIQTRAETRAVRRLRLRPLRMALLNGVRARVAAVGAAAALLASPGVRTQAPGEDELRATYLYNFPKYVEWPAVPNGKPGEPFRMCVVADDRLARRVESLVRGESVRGRRLVFARPTTPRAARDCELLYIGRSNDGRVARMLAAVRDLPVLTVGDTTFFLERGGAIEFVVVRRRVTFDVNLAAAQRARLRISSKLLGIARQVFEGTR